MATLTHIMILALVAGQASTLALQGGGDRYDQNPFGSQVRAVAKGIRRIEHAVEHILHTGANSSNRVKRAAAAAPDPLPCDEINILTLAEMSNQVYDLAKSTVIGTNAAAAAAGFTAQEAWKTDHGWQRGKIGTWIPSYAVYVREKPCRQAVVVIKGTSPNVINDIRADVLSIQGGIQPTMAMEKIGNVVLEWKKKGYTVFSTGHSLGGYVGEVTSTRHNLPGAVFCAPGPDSLFTKHNGNYPHPKFQNLNHEHDVLGNLGTGTFYHKQWSVYVHSDNLPHHAITTMIRVLKTKAGWQNMTNGNVVSFATGKLYGYLL